MEVELIRSSVGPGSTQFLTSTVINRQVALDAGCIGLLELERQREIEHLFLSHAHLDHVATLPIFLDNVFDGGPSCPTVYATKGTWRAVRESLFNDRLWPDLVSLSTGETPFLQTQSVRPEVPIRVGELQVTAIELNHIIPTVGYLVASSDSAAAFVTDTGPTASIWEWIDRNEKVDTVFLEASFPERMQWLANQSCHLTPQGLARELQKLTREVRVIAVHLKAAYRDEIEAELMALDIPRLEVGVPGRVYRC